MLLIKPNCECCDCDLPANSNKAQICSYECTFCADCVDSILSNVCSNCGGGFTARPIRPSREYRNGVSLLQQAASTERVNTPYTKQEIVDFSASIRDTDASLR